MYECIYSFWQAIWWRKSSILTILREFGYGKNQFNVPYHHSPHSVIPSVRLDSWEPCRILVPKRNSCRLTDFPAIETKQNIKFHQMNRIVVFRLNYSRLIHLLKYCEIQLNILEASFHHQPLSKSNRKLTKCIWGNFSFNPKMEIKISFWF